MFFLETWFSATAMVESLAAQEQTQRLKDLWATRLQEKTLDRHFKVDTCWVVADRMIMYHLNFNAFLVQHDPWDHEEGRHLVCTFPFDCCFLSHFGVLKMYDWFAVSSFFFVAHFFPTQTIKFISISKLYVHTTWRIKTNQLCNSKLTGFKPPISDIEGMIWRDPDLFPAEAQGNLAGISGILSMPQDMGKKMTKTATQFKILPTFLWICLLLIVLPHMMLEFLVDLWWILCPEKSLTSLLKGRLKQSFPTSFFGFQTESGAFPLFWFSERNKKWTIVCILGVLAETSDI